MIYKRNLTTGTETKGRAIIGLRTGFTRNVHVSGLGSRWETIVVNLRKFVPARLYQKYYEINDKTETKSFHQNITNFIGETTFTLVF